MDTSELLTHHLSFNLYKSYLKWFEKCPVRTTTSKTPQETEEFFYDVLLHKLHTFSFAFKTILIIMKRRLITLIFVLFVTVSFAQNTSQPPVQNISTDSDAVYRLFSTRNLYTFIKLNTKNGQMWQVQWDTKSSQFETPLSLQTRVLKEDEKNGRFFLYPTTNVYNFILLDQIDGRVWQVQWSTEPKERMVIPIN